MIKNHFGPMGVDTAYRGRKALLLACLHAMAAQGVGLYYHRLGGAKRVLYRNRWRN